MADTTTTTILPASDRLLTLSNDGRYAAYCTIDANDVDTLYVLDLQTNLSVPVDSFTSNKENVSDEDAFSDFTNVTFSSNNDYLFYGEGYADASDGPGEIFVRNLTNSAPPINVTPSVPPGGNQLLPAISTFQALAISDDGNIIVYDEEYYDPSGQNPPFYGIVVENRTTGAIVEQLNSADAGEKNGEYQDVQLSGDGRYLNFWYAGDAFTQDLQSNTQQVLPVFDSNQPFVIIGSGTPEGFSAASADGRYLSYDDPLGGLEEVYLHDNAAPPNAQDQIISTSADGVVANGNAVLRAFSGNGEFLVFSSDATNLIPGVSDGSYHNYIKDVETGAIRQLPDDIGFSPSVSNDGSEILYQTEGGGVVVTTINKSALTVNAINGRDYVNGTDNPLITVSGTSDAIGQTIFLSFPGGGLFATASAVVQADGTWTTTISTSRLGEGAADLHAVVTDDFNNTTTVDHPFIVDRTPPTDLAITSVAGDNIINAAEISHTTITGTVQIADPAGNGTDAGSLTISIDGGGSKSFVTQPSGSLVDADFSQVLDASGVTDGEHTITLTATDPAGNTATVTKQVLVDTTPPKIAITSISGDDVINPTELKTEQDIHGTSDAIGQTVTVSLNGNAIAQAVVQANGTWLTTGDFSAANSGENLVTAAVADEAGNPGQASGNAYVDRGFSAQQLSDGPAGQQGGGSGVAFPVFDAAGDKLVFTGVNFNLMSTATSADGAQVYIKDLTTGVVTFATPDPSENSEFAGISQDGNYIEFVSNANLDDAVDVTGNPPGYYLTYTEDLSTDAIYIHNLTDDAYDGTDPDTLNPGITPGYYALGNYADGTPIASLPVYPLAIADGGNALELIDDLEPDQVVVPLVMTTQIRLDVNSVDGNGQPFDFSGGYAGPDAVPPNDNPYGRFVVQEYDPQISADGSVIAFAARFYGELWDTSVFPAAVTIESPTITEIYAGTAPPDAEQGNDPLQELASSYADGTPMPFGAVDPALSADGKFVAFWSWDNSDNLEVYRKNLTTGALEVVSSDANGVAGVNNVVGNFTGGADTIAISSDGRYVAFTSDAVLTSDDSGTGADLFIKDMQTGAITRLNLPSGTFANDLSTQLTMNADGSYVAFVTSKGLSTLDNNGVADVYGVSVAAAESTPPQIAISPVTGNDMIDAAEDSTHLTVSGTSDAIGQTVTLYVDGGFLPGVTVGSGGTWSTTIDTTGLSDGVHQLRATVATSSGTTDTAGDLITIDRVAPTVTLSADNTHLAPGQSATITAHFDEGIGGVGTGFLSATGGTLSDIEFTDNETLTALFTPSSGATAYSVEANSGTYFDFAGNAGISGASLDLGAPVGSGQIITVSSGQTGSGHTVLSGGQLVVSSGGSDVSPVLSSGGSETVSSGGTTIDTAVSSGGSLIVSSGGVADPTTINAGGSEIVSAGGTDLGALVFGGSQSDFGFTSGVTVFAGGEQFVYGSAVSTFVSGTNAILSVGVGGVVSGAVIGSGAYILNTGVASGTQVRSGGQDYVSAGASETGTVVSGGLDYIFAGGSGFGATIGNGASQQVYGFASGTTILAGGSEGVYGSASGTVVSGTNAIVSVGAGGTAFNATVGSGAFLLDTGIASGTQVKTGGQNYVTNGGSENGTIVSGGGLDYIEAGGSGTGATVSSGGTQLVYGFASGADILAGGSEGVYGSASATLVSGLNAILSVGVGGAVSGTTVGSGAYLLNGGIASRTQVNNGGRDFVLSGGSETGATVGSALDYIEAGGIEIGATIGAGGNQTVFGTANGTVLSGSFAIESIQAGGTASGTVVSSGTYVLDAGNASGTQVKTGGQDYIYSGGSETGATFGSALDYIETGGVETGATVGAGGNQTVFGIANATTMSGSFAIESVQAGGTASGTTLDSGSYLLDGGVASGVIVNSGGQDYIEAGGSETGAIFNGSLDYIETGGVETRATIGAGGNQTVFGVANATTVSGTFAIESIKTGGTASGTVLEAGGYILNAGIASGTIVSANGSDFIMSGGKETGATVSNGGLQFVEVGGTANSTTIAAGGNQTIYGVANATTLSGALAVESIKTGGTASGTTLDSGGFVFNAGTELGTQISANGSDFIQTGGTTINATVFNGGYDEVETGGAMSGVTISSGGALTIDSGATFSGTVTFVSNGGLTLGDSVDFTGLVAGFSGTQVFMDLKDIPYVSGGSGATTVTWNSAGIGSGSGKLVVSGGGHSADLTLLGNYMQQNFAFSTDGHGGTFVIDPPVATTDSATTLVNHG